VLSINDTLSLDYEIKNGLKKARSLSFINIISILLIIPVFIIFFANPDIKRLKDISDITKDSIFKVLQPKTPLLKLYDSCFNAPEESTYTIKSSLENTFVVSGFYNPNNNSIRSFEDQEKIKKDLKNVMVLAGICSLIVLSFLMALFKIIRNSMLKINLVEGQLNTHSGPERLGN